MQGAQVVRSRRRRTSTTCARCAVSFTITSWSELALIERLEHEQLRDLLTQWPWGEGELLEIRRCSCGHELAWLVVKRPQA